MFEKHDDNRVITPLASLSTYILHISAQYKSVIELEVDEMANSFYSNASVVLPLSTVLTQY